MSNKIEFVNLMQSAKRMSEFLYYSAGAIANPAKQGEITATFPTTRVLEAMRDKMLSSPSGRNVLRFRPIISSQTVNIDKLRQLPKNTFGFQYSQFLDKERVSPDTRTPIKFLPENSELAYVMLRYRQTHDFLHTLTGVPTTLSGEIALKWFEYTQNGLPMNLLAGMFGPLRLLNAWEFQDPLKRHEDYMLQKFLTESLPWAIQSGAEATFLLNCFFEKHFEQDLDKLRRELRIIPFPQ